jgi:adenylate cyclase
MFKGLKSNYIYILSAFIIALIVSSIYIFSPALPNTIDNRLKDYMFKVRGEMPPQTDSIIIIDIDEKSLRSLGQWPWSRDTLKIILENLSKANIGIIGMDIVFAEEDRTSPHKVFDDLNIKRENIPNYDFEFAQTVASTPTILGYQFEFQDNKYTNKEAPSIQTIFIEKKKKLGKQHLIQAKGTILNIPVIQDNSYSSGFFNNIPDESGIVRSVPLIISYDDEIYPSLALEILRIAMGIKKIYINYNDNGVENIKIGDYLVQTDRHGRVLINFRGKEKTFKYISAVDIYNNDFNKIDIQDKIALIGTSAAALMDLRATPFESIFPGVEVHANVIDNIIAQDYLYKASWVDGANIFIVFCLIIITIYSTKKIPIFLIPISSSILLALCIYGIYYLLFHEGTVLNLFFPIFTIILSTIVTIMIQYFYEIKRKEEIKSKFASKVSKDVMEELIKNIDDNKLQAQNKEVTVYFSDIRGFTSISETIGDPAALVSYINQYMTPMSEIITNNKGTIDKYIGDAIMAYWNAPFDVKNHEDMAVISAIEQLIALKKLNIKLQANNQPIINIGIGITTGIATIGEIGSIGRSDYTAIGDTINLGSRIESLCKFYKSELLISNITKNKLTNDYTFRYIDHVKVKGKNNAIELWEVISLKKEDPILNKELEEYNKAIDLYKKGQLKEALKIFELLKNTYEHHVYSIYYNRCEHHLSNNTFDLIYTHTEKA